MYHINSIGRIIFTIYIAHTMWSLPSNGHHCTIGQLLWMKFMCKNIFEFYFIKMYIEIK